jgi:uncharacterized protein YndB with AHSA1/START domain
VIRVAILVLGVIVILVLAVIAIGYALPVAHVASRDATLPAPPERVFAALQDVDRFPSWRSDVKSVDVLARTPRLRWREDGSNGPITFEVQEHDPPRRMVSRIADTSLPFGGSWTYVLTPAGTGTRIAITENGEVYNPLFRFMSRFVFGHTATMEAYLRDLQRYLEKREL